MSNAAWNRWKIVKAATNLRSNNKVASHLLDTWERAQMPGHVEPMDGTSTADPSTPRRPLQSTPAHFCPIKELEAIVSGSELSGVEQISLVEKYEKKAKFAEGSFIKPRSELSDVGDQSVLGKYEIKAQSAEGCFINISFDVTSTTDKKDDSYHPTVSEEEAAYEDDKDVFSSSSEEDGDFDLDMSLRQDDNLEHLPILSPGEAILHLSES